MYRFLCEVFFGTRGSWAVLLLAFVMACASVLLAGLGCLPWSWADWLVAAVAVVGGTVDAASFLFPVLLLLRVSVDTVPEPKAAELNSGNDCSLIACSCRFRQL